MNDNMIERKLWQPIETMPRIGQHGGPLVLAYDFTNGVYVAGWRRGQIVTKPGHWARHPTHWMPLPAPPAEQARL